MLLATLCQADDSGHCTCDDGFGGADCACSKSSSCLGATVVRARAGQVCQVAYIEIEQPSGSVESVRQLPKRDTNYELRLRHGELLTRVEQQQYPKNHRFRGYGLGYSWTFVTSHNRELSFHGWCDWVKPHLETHYVNREKTRENECEGSCEAPTVNSFTAPAGRSIYRLEVAPGGETEPSNEQGLKGDGNLRSVYTVSGTAELCSADVHCSGNGLAYGDTSDGCECKCDDGFGGADCSCAKLSNDFVKLGTGFCGAGFYAGWNAADAATLETCKAKCRSEPTCQFFALKNWPGGGTCSRYTGTDCTAVTPDGRHALYKRVESACVITAATAATAPATTTAAPTPSPSTTTKADATPPPAKVTTPHSVTPAASGTHTPATNAPTRAATASATTPMRTTPTRTPPLTTKCNDACRGSAVRGRRRWRAGGGPVPFTVVYSKGSAFGPSTDTSTASEAAAAKKKFNGVFQTSTAGIVRRECPVCATSHADVYFKRLTAPRTFDAWQYLMVTWSSTGNTMGSDFTIHSSLEDALAGMNPWSACNFDDVGIGFPRDCGPNRAGNYQWNSLIRGGITDVRYSVYTAE